jgi:hypothetical protein
MFLEAGGQVGRWAGVFNFRSWADTGRICVGLHVVRVGQAIIPKRRAVLNSSQVESAQGLREIGRSCPSLIPSCRQMMAARIMSMALALAMD